MDKYIINGGKKISGETTVSGSKNVALKAIVAACLTNDEVVIENIPLISELFVMTDIVEELGGRIDVTNHTLTIKLNKLDKTRITLERAAEIRSSALFLAPLLARKNEAIIPNPGGCRIGSRPIDRTIQGLEKMGVDVEYNSKDGYFHMKAINGLKGVDYTFKKSTHTGTETLIMAAVLAKGKTILKNCAQEPEVNELIGFLISMGAKIKKLDKTTIEIEGVNELHKAKFKIGPDRNEIVTLAIAAVLTKGDIFIDEIKNVDLCAFTDKLIEAGAGVEEKNDGVRFYFKGPLKAVNIDTSPYPGFMTDWQAPWAVLMTQANGISNIHERVYETRFGYVDQLQKLGANIKLYNPKIDDPQEYYNFNIEDDLESNMHAAKITGPVTLHNGVVKISDLRAGATLVLAALAAKGESVILEVYHLDRGYEKFENRLNSLGADIMRVNDE